MVGKSCFKMVVVLVAASLVFGCSRKTPPKIATDPSFAQSVVNSVYAGSLNPVKADIAPVFQKALPDFVAAGTSAVLTERYGAVKSVQFQSSKILYPRQLNATEAIWTVAGERSSYEMKIVFDKGGKVIDLAFRPSPAQEWVTAMEMGVNYVKQTKGR